MEAVEDEDGRRLLVEKRSADAWLVRDPESGERRYRDPAELSVLDDVAPLAAAAAGVPEPTRALLRAAHGERVLGLAVTVVDRGPVAVRSLLDATTLCESDLHGALAELVAADLLVEVEVAGERGYEATPAGEAAVAHLRGAGPDD